jgi:diguanylate cyclase (GGDEF)-like protein
MDWTETWFAPTSQEGGVLPGEDVLHDLARDLDAAADSRAVDQALTAAARRVAGSYAVEWIPGSGTRPLSDTATAIELRRRGGGTWGRLLVDHPAARSAIVLRRLETLGAMASCALDRLDAGDRNVDRGSSRAVEVRDSKRSKAASEKVAEESDLGFYPSAPTVHDATFLNAVFPFALSQARRHGESLAVLCVAIDRLKGIRDLLGTDQVDRTVLHTGRKIATLIRASDIVARLDDDRLMVLLPRAELDDGVTVARKVCQGVSENASLLSDAPELTLSVGVASYPSCATNLYELLDASDSALSEAQSRGRNRVASAPTIAVERKPRLRSCAI